MISTIAAKAKFPVWAQPNLISNILKSLLLGQSYSIPEGLTPFEIPSAPLHQLLSQFNVECSSVIINSYEISASNDNWLLMGRKGSRDSLSHKILIHYFTILTTLIS